MKLRFTIIFSILVGCSYCQDTLQTTKNIKRHSTITFGLEFIQISNLNSALKKLNYESIDPMFFSFGIGQSYWKNKFYSGIDFKISSSFQQISAGVGLIQGYFNYIVLDNDKFSLAPGVDFGYQLMRSKIKRKNASNSFDSLFLISGNYVSIDNSTSTTGVSIITCIKRVSKTKRKHLDPNYYIRLGYRYGLSNHQWKADGNELLNSPQDRLSNFYIQTIFSF